MSVNIPAPHRINNKIEGDFYPLQKEELIALKKAKIINNTAYVHLALRFENPYCDHPIEVIPKEFALRWSIPESSVYEAISKLKQLGILNIKTGKIVIEWTNSQQTEPIDSQQDSDSGNPEKFRDPRKNSEIPEKIPRSQKKFRDPRKNSEIPENQTPEPLPEEDSNSPQTIQTYSDFKKTLSEDERENFFNFVRKEIENLPKKVNDLEAWLANKNQAGQNRWEVYYKNFLASLQDPSSDSSMPSGKRMSEIQAKAAQCRTRFKEEIEQQRIAAERAFQEQTVKRTEETNDDRI